MLLPRVFLWHNKKNLDVKQNVWMLPSPMEPRKQTKNYRMGPPKCDVCWFINPMNTIVIYSYIYHKP